MGLDRVEWDEDDPSPWAEWDEIPPPGEGMDFDEDLFWTTGIRNAKGKTERIAILTKGYFVTTRRLT